MPQRRVVIQLIGASDTIRVGLQALARHGLDSATLFPGAAVAGDSVTAADDYRWPSGFACELAPDVTVALQFLYNPGSTAHVVHAVLPDAFVTNEIALQEDLAEGSTDI